MNVADEGGGYSNAKVLLGVGSIVGHVVQKGTNDSAWFRDGKIVSFSLLHTDLGYSSSTKKAENMISGINRA